MPQTDWKENIGFSIIPITQKRKTKYTPTTVILKETFNATQFRLRAYTTHIWNVWTVFIKRTQHFVWSRKTTALLSPENELTNIFCDVWPLFPAGSQVSKDSEEIIPTPVKTGKGTENVWAIVLRSVLKQDVDAFPGYQQQGGAVYWIIKQ